MINLTTAQAELLAQILGGGASPKEGDTLQFKREGWRFGKVTASLPFFDVAAFGAVGDGATDDTAAIQNTIAEAFNLGGGVVYLAQGIYLVSGLKVSSKVVLIGSGVGSVLKQSADAHTVVDSGTSSGGNTPFTLNDTSKAWTTRQWRGHSVRITGGTGAGQVRFIQTNTATQLILDGELFSPVPDATSTYEILDPTAVIELNTTDTEFVGVLDLQIDGNKANQTAHCAGILLHNDAGGPTFLDEHHLVENVLIRNTKGSSIAIGDNVREARFINVNTRDSDRYGLETLQQGGTDNWFIACTFAGHGLSGCRANSDASRWIGCKAFGNGKKNITGNACGFLITGGAKYFTSCEAQENFEHGFALRGAQKVSMSDCIADANDGNGVLLENTLDCHIQCLVSSTPGLLYQTDWAIQLISGSDRNHINLVVKSSELSSGFINPTESVGADNVILLNSRWYHRGLFHIGRAAGVTGEEHFTWGKRSSPATNNPYYTIKTSGDAVPKASIDGYDGTTSKTFITFDFENGKLILGSPDVTVVGGGGGGGTLDGLSDVTITSVADRHILRYDAGSSQWINSDHFLSRVFIDYTAGSDAGLVEPRAGGVKRWAFGSGGQSETGGNAGSDFNIFRYDDAGNFLGTVLTIRRSDGNVAINGAISGDMFKVNGVIHAVDRVKISPASAGASALVQTRSASDVERWQFGQNNDVESGSNTGSNFIISRYSDAGVFLSSPIQINRQTGAVTITPALGATSGGTGQASYVSGAILFATSSTTLAQLAPGSNGQVLTIVGGVPTWANPSGGGGASVLNDLNDVNLGIPNTGHTLSFSGGVWTNIVPGGGGFPVGDGRAINTGTGLTGGGNLTINRTISIDTSIVPRKNVQEFITADWVWDHASIDIRGAAGSLPAIIHTRNGASLRWDFGNGSEPETGGNAGSRFYIARFNDAGSFIDRVFEATRNGTDPIFIRVGGALKQVTQGAVDSGGAGFRVLRVPN